MSHIIGYARVSTDDQNLAGQRLRLEGIGAVRVFEDMITGKRMDRPGLKALLDYARPGDTLAVVRLDRLGRSLRELLELLEDLKRREIAFRSLEEHIDTSSAAGELILHVFASIAQFERRLIGDRTRDALAARRAKGVRLGRAPVPQERVTAAIALVDSGMTPTDAASVIGVSRSILYREMKNRDEALSPSEDGVPVQRYPRAKIATRPNRTKASRSNGVSAS